VVDLVGTGPVLLGAYTIAELTAVDAVVDFLEARPPDEALTEAVQSLAARQLISLSATRASCTDSRGIPAIRPSSCPAPGKAATSTTRSPAC